MHYIVCGTTYLSRLQHHWFWGLQVNKEGSANSFLAGSAKRLANNAQARRVEKANVAAIQKKSTPIRAIYWVFNLGNYRQYYYELAACYLFMFFQMGIERAPFIKAIATQEDAYEMESNLFQNVSLHIDDDMPMTLIYHFSHVIKTMLKLQQITIQLDELPINNKKQTFFASTNENESASRDNEFKPDIVVNASQLQALNILGLTLTVGARLTLPDLKNAYKKALLIHHPDKSGNPEQCKAVINAFAFLAKTNQEVFSNESDFMDMIYKELAEMDRRLNNLTIRLEKLTAETKELTAETKELTAETKELTIETKKLTVETNKLTALTKELTAETKELTAETNKLTAETKELTAETKELTAETNKLTALTKELTAETKELTIETKKLTVETNKLTALTKELVDNSNKNKQELEQFRESCQRSLIEGMELNERERARQIATEPKESFLDLLQELKDLETITHPGQQTLADYNLFKFKQKRMPELIEKLNKLFPPGTDTNGSIMKYKDHVTRYLQNERKIFLNQIANEGTQDKIKEAIQGIRELSFFAHYDIGPVCPEKPFPSI